MIIYLEDKRRESAEWILKLQHLSAGLPLLVIGLKNLAGDEAERPMAALQVAVAAAVLLAFLKEWFARRHSIAHAETASHSAIGWFDLAAGALLIFEAFHGAHTKPGYLRPPFFSGLLTLGLGAFHGAFQRFRRGRRYLKLDEKGLDFRLSPFRRLRLRWIHLASIELSATRVVFLGTDGRCRILKLSRFRNANVLCEGIADHAGAAGLLIKSGAAVPVS